MTVRTVTLPTNAGAPWEYFAWPSKYPSDDLTYALDCMAWLADGDLILEAATVSASPGLTVVRPPALTGPGNMATIVSVQLVGGAPGTTAQVAFVLELDSRRQATVIVALPIRLGPPPGLVPAWSGISADSTLVTADSDLITADAE